MICPSCAYRDADEVTGFCSVCIGQLALFADGMKPCEHCGSIERNYRGDCSPCHRAASRARYRPTGRKPGRPRIMAPCSEPGCTRPYHAAGYCRPHYLAHWAKARRIA
jgi:hypothetical protein